MDPHRGLSLRGDATNALPLLDLGTWKVRVSVRVTVRVTVWLGGNVVGHIHKVTLRRAGLVLRWVTVRGYTILVFKSTKPPRPTQPGHPSVGRRNEY